MSAALSKCVTMLLKIVGEAEVISCGQLISAKRNPSKIIMGLVQPVMFVVLFSLILGNAINVPGHNYTDYMIPAIIVYQVLFSSAGTATEIAFDRVRGVSDRYRVLPIHRTSYLLARVFTDIIITLTTVMMIGVSGLIVGWRPILSIENIPYLIGLPILLRMLSSWLGILVGLSVKVPEIASQTVVFCIVPLTFLSNMLVPSSQLPAGVQFFSRWNPISLTNDMMRQAFGDVSSAPTSGQVVTLIISTCSIVAICIVGSVYKFNSLGKASQ